MKKLSLRIATIFMLITISMQTTYGVLALPSEPQPNVYIGTVPVPKFAVFTPTGNMSVARRYDAIPVLLQNGKVLVVGGNSSSCTPADLYDPSTGLWSSTGSMNSCRGNFSLTLLQDGSVLAAGGGFGTEIFKSSELYSPSSGTWTSTGNLNEARNGHSATLLNNGKVLVAGGWSGTYRIGSAELYDPSTGEWTTTDDLVNARYRSKETLLNNGKVLLTGGNTNLESTEYFDPLVNIWFSTGNLNEGRDKNTATLLANGKVLVAGGINSNLELNSSELYSTSTSSWSGTGEMNYPRVGHTATLLGFGQVLVAGGSIEDIPLAIAELYNPDSGAWDMTASMNVARTDHLAILLDATHVLVAGGWDSESPPGYNSAEIGTFRPANTFNATLTLPSQWLNSTNVEVQFIGNSSGAAINAGSLSNDNNNWGDWVAAIPGEVTPTIWDIGGEGENLPIHFRLRDIYDQVATVVMGTVDVDITPPTGSVSLQENDSNNSAFTSEVTLLLSATDNLSGVSDMQISNSPDFSTTVWEPYTTNREWDMQGSFVVFARFRDNAGNLSDIFHTHYLNFFPLIIK